MSVASAVGLASALRGIVPRERVVDGEAARRWSGWEGTPGAVVFPASTDEAARVLARASEEGWTVEPAGSGTWLWPGSAATPPDLVLSASGMARIIEYDPADLTVTAEAGMTLPALASLITPQHQWLPLDPPGRSHSLGAVAATGVWGPLGAAWGGPRDLVLGLRAVTGDGRAFRAGGRVVKNVAGFDLVRLLIGSRGALAFITEVTVRLFPLPEADHTLVIGGGRLDELVDAAVRACALPVTPAAVELLERQAPPGGRSEVVLAVRVLGGRERLEAEEAVLRAALAGSGELTRLAPAEADTLWREVGHLEEGAELVLRLSIAPARIRELIDPAQALRSVGGGQDERESARMAVHSGAGVLRLAVPKLRVDSGWDERWADRLEDLMGALSRRDGTLTVTRAPAPLRARLKGRESSAVDGELMSGLKVVFDPAEILSGGRFALGHGSGAAAPASDTGSGGGQSRA